VLCAVRLARLRAPCWSPPGRICVCGFGGDTTTGLSVDDCDQADVVTDSNAALESRAAHAQARDVVLSLRMYGTARSTANSINRHTRLPENLPFAPDAADQPALATLRSTPPDAFAHDHGW